RSECDTAGKHPRTRHGLKDGATDKVTIQQWWTETPQANIGIVTGPESGLFMLGPDGQAGIDALAALEHQYGLLPKTPRTRSGGGGRHYYFRWPAQARIRNRRNINGLPIDVRGAGGYAVAAPSLHESGNTYEWEIAPNDAELAQAPTWLLEWLGHKRDSARFG